MAGSRYRFDDSFYRDLAENISDMVQCVSPSGKLIYTNRAWRRILGYTSKEAEKMTLFDIIHPDFRSRCRSVLRRINAGEKMPLVRTDFITKRGKRLHVEGVVHVRKSKGKILYNQTVFRDITRRVKQETMLSEREQEFRALFDNSPDIQMLVSLKGKIFSVNQTILRYGFRPKDLIGHSMLEFVPKSAWPAILKSLLDLKRGKQNRGITRVFTPRGPVMVEWWSTPLRKQGKIVGLHTSLRDITQQHEAEQQMRWLMKGFETSNDVIFTTNREGIIQHINPAFTRLYGYAWKDVTGKTPRILKSDHFKRPFYRALWRRLLRKETILQEFINRKKDGKLVTMQAVLSPILDNEQKIMGFMAVQRDITKEKAHQQELKKEKEFSERVIETAPGLIVGLDKKGRIILFNAGAEWITGYKKREVMGKDWFSLFIPARKQKPVRSVLNGLLKGKPLFHHENVIRTKDGKEKVISWYNNIINDEQGKIKMVLAEGRDITLRRDAEEKMKEFQRRLLKAQRVSKMGFLDWDLKTGKIYLSEEVIELYGLKPGTDEVTFDMLMKYVHPGDRDMIKKGFRMAFRGTAALDLDHRIRRRDGKELWLHAHAELDYDAKGHKRRVLGTVIDVTDRKRAETALRESENKFKTLFDSSVDALMVLAPPSWRFIEGNQATLSLFGCKSEEAFTTKTPWDLSPPEQPDGTLSRMKAKKMISMALKEGHAYFDWVHQRQDGTTFPATILLSRFSKNKRFALQATIRDISKERAAEHEREKMNSELQRKVDDLERFQKFTVGRELRMVELKKRIRQLEAKQGSK
ncbi:MAG: PAS domain S-box protein [DPANN group archaeon]|nr:PAS domain S-box protein [DPANN group archaeon]